jgi:hypothetical protein
VSAPQLRPLGIGEVLDVAMKIVWRNAWTLVRAVFVVVFPVQVLATVIQISAAPQDFDPFLLESESPDAVFSDTDYAAIIGGTVTAGVLTLLAGLLAAGACYRAIATAYLGEQTGWRDSLRYASRRFHSIIWVSFLSGLLALLGLIACIIPGIYLWVCFAVAVPVLMTESTRGRKALGRSRRLVQGFWWRVFAVVLLGVILTSIVEGALSGLLVGALLAGTDPNGFVGSVVNAVASTGGSLLTTPFTAAFTTVLYFDLRVRKEAFDLQLLAARLGVEPPAGYAPPPEPPASKPPFWPPPPGWQPEPSSAPGPAELGADEPDDQPPPFWPPPPSWKRPGS